MKVAVSIIKSKYNEKETVDIINQTSADYLHLDIMDGEFVKNKTYDFEDILLITKDNHKPLDVHLMVKDVESYLNDYITLNPDIISFHIEAVRNPKKYIDLLHDHDIKCGLAINPDTDIKKVIPYLDKIDTVLIMSVYPGEGGQKFIKDTEEKIIELKKLQTNFEIEVDGGVNIDSIEYASLADVVVSGSYICKSDDYESNIQKLREYKKQT